MVCGALSAGGGAASDVARTEDAELDSSNIGEDAELDSSNRGHALLERMGWVKGVGLGLQGQGELLPASVLLARRRGLSAGVERLEQATWGDTPGTWEGFSN